MELPKTTKVIKSLAKSEHKWAIATIDSGNSTLIIRYNLTAKDWLAHPDLSIKLGFAIPLINPTHEALPQPSENSQIDQIEDIIRHEVLTTVIGLHALSLTTGHMKEFVFYINPTPEIGKIHTRIKQQVQTPDVQCMAIREPDWDSYRKFTPTE
jgi:hypothetical protein